jgi:protein ImuA
MHNVGREQRLADLRIRIAAIEKRPLLVEGAGLPSRGEGRPRPSAESVLRAPAGLLHEVYADEQRNGGAALGFALGLARGLLTPERPAILMLQLGHEVEESGLPYGPGLSAFGFAPEQLILGRLANPVELLWAVEEAIACRAVAGVVAEVLGAPKALDFTNSRRLALRAASGGASVLLVRYGQEREASAARLRWRITPAESQAPPFDARAPGRARWQVVLEKGRLGAGLMEAGLEFWLDWTENGFAAVAGKEFGGERGEVARPAPHGASPAALGHRLSQAG